MTESNLSYKVWYPSLTFNWEDFYIHVLERTAFPSRLAFKLFLIHHLLFHNFATLLSAGLSLPFAVKPN